MKLWQSIPRPLNVEADIPLKNQAPEEVLSLYETCEKGTLVAWISADEKLCGCIRHNRSVAAETEHAAVLSVFEIKPAKGTGWVGMTINSKEGEVLATLFESRYSRNSLNWLKGVQPELAKLLGLAQQYRDEGYDT